MHNKLAQSDLKELRRILLEAKIHSGQLKNEKDGEGRIRRRLLLLLLFFIVYKDMLTYCFVVYCQS